MGAAAERRPLPSRRDRRPLPPLPPFPAAALGTATALLVSGRLGVATGAGLVASVLVVVLTVVVEVEVRDVKETGLPGPDVYEGGLDPG